MARLESLDEVKSVTVHWSESTLINEELDCNDDGDIEKKVDPIAFDDLIKRAALKVGEGYDKTSLSVTSSNGLQWCNECKFYLTRNTKSLIGLLNNESSE